jgi:hypothetical protein
MGRSGTNSKATLKNLPESLGNFLIDGVHQIDLSCSSTLHGIERGICNVKGHYSAEALEATGAKLTEETITSWLLSRRLASAGLPSDLERRYPGARKRCDLVVTLPGAESGWIEVKYAWKTWFNCDGSSVRNKVYGPYLYGDKYHPHCALNDFRKLEGLSPSDAKWAGFLLIGTDSTRHPMAADIERLESLVDLDRAGWKRVAQRYWQDRRCTGFGIGCWFWLRAQPSH